MKPTPLAEGPVIYPAAVVCYMFTVLQKSLHASQVEQKSAHSKMFPPLEFRHPCEEHGEHIKWNLSFSIKSHCITLAANPCNKAADAPNTDLIYHFKRPEYSHHNEKSGLKTSKIPHGPNKKEARADRRVFGTAGQRETNIHFYSLEERVQERVVVSLIQKCQETGRSSNQIKSKAAARRGHGKFWYRRKWCHRKSKRLPGFLDSGISSIKTKKSMPDRGGLVVGSM